MSHIFISYSRNDTQNIDRLITKLRQAGCNIWIDRTGIQGGEQWRQRIVNAIDGCNIFVVILSPNSIKSRNVRKELDLAEVRNKTILPVILAPVTIPTELEYQLVGLQTIDLTTNFDAGFTYLLRALGMETFAVTQDANANSLSIKADKTTHKIPAPPMYDVSLQIAGSRKKEVIAAIQAVTDLNANLAKKLALEPPSIILARVTKGVAEKAKSKLEEAGAVIIIQPH